MNQNTKVISGNHDNPLLSSSSSILANVNTDLLTEILLRLPVKSLLVFKSVSKQWSLFISSPYFVRQHCIHNKFRVSRLLLSKSSSENYMQPQKYELILHHERILGNRSVPYQALSASNQPLGFHIYQSCNGLLLCSIDKPSWNLYIYNPSTKHYRSIPTPYGKNKYMCSLSLVFDPVKLLDYEIVCIWREHISIQDEYKFEIYSSKTNSWRVLGDIFSVVYPFCFHLPGVLWNGCLNWFSQETRSMLYFDIRGDVLKTLPFSPINSGDKLTKSFRMYFGECTGQMYLVLSAQPWPPTGSFYIFEMEVDYQGWKLKSVVHLGELPKPFDILQVEQGGEEEKLKVLIHLPYKIISYGLKKNGFTMEEIYGSAECTASNNRYSRLQPQEFLNLTVSNYIESLADV